MSRFYSRFTRRFAVLGDNLRGSLLMMLAMGAFVVNDTFVKLASDDMHPAQIMAVRGVMATGLLYLLARSRKAQRPLRDMLQPSVMLRAGADILATITYILGLANLPIANASAIFQALPLTVTLGAALFLREPVGWRRWLAIMIGFAGVLIVVQPGADGFNVYALCVLASVVFAGTRDLVTRTMPRTLSALFVSTTTSLLVTLTGWVILPFVGWSDMHVTDWAHLCCAAVAIIIGYIAIVEAMRIGDMGVVAPFRYSVLIYALLIGFVVFGDVPGLTVLFGASIIVGSGFYTLYRERVRGGSIAAKASVHTKTV
ncbi:DMT family transporter [Mangrovibrevibacter kandeliae]|uniref:DMT family transporter n=1 Tax=Mangrovibrevibacter kandeliae TaxID=2968473 RepID=UPI0021187DF9|nr:DMT family transporter [Aurantimonas sp. CSK15Z-1]MCQ8781271.1 DMT family transporter [Aurantimonas sp. CSK15Z-1]